jgi:hypothetical protein
LQGSASGLVRPQVLTKFQNYFGKTCYGYDESCCCWFATSSVNLVFLKYSFASFHNRYSSF